MIRPTLGWLTKICLYLPEQSSRAVIFLLCQRAKPLKVCFHLVPQSFFSLSFSLPLSLCWHIDYVGWRLPVSSASSSQTSQTEPDAFVPTYSLCSRPGEKKKNERGWGAGRASSEGRVWNPPWRKNRAFHRALPFPLCRLVCCSQRQQTGG